MAPASHDCATALGHTDREVIKEEVAATQGGKAPGLTSYLLPSLTSNPGCSIPDDIHHSFGSVNSRSSYSMLEFPRRNPPSGLFWISILTMRPRNNKVRSQLCVLSFRPSQTYFPWLPSHINLKGAERKEEGLWSLDGAMADSISTRKCLSTGKGKPCLCECPCVPKGHGS